MKLTILFTLFLLLSFTAASGATRRNAHKILLGETEISVNVYENAGANVTFFAPHHNEQTALKLAKEFVEKNGGRVVEIESYDENGNPSRYLKFNFKGKSYSVDPNRIFTQNGRSRAGISGELEQAIKAFADALLPIIFSADGKSLRENEKFIVAVHNNADVDAKDADAKSGDLTAVAFVKGDESLLLSHGAFEAQADGVYLSNTETDADNFVFLSMPKYVSHFAERGFNVVIQKSAAKLQSKQCSIDDGSLSVYSAQSNISYICLEADGANGAFRQRQMLEAVYGLLPQSTFETNLNAVVK